MPRVAINRGAIAYWAIAAIAIVAAAVSAFAASGAGGAAATGGAPKATSSTTKVGVLPRVGAVTATCKRGSRPASGGFEGEQVTLTDGVIPWSSERKGRRGWRVTGSASTQRRALTAFAYCRKGGKPIAARSKSAVLPSATMKTVTKRCKRGERVVSGGFSSGPAGAGPAGLGVARLFINRSQRAGGRKWQVRAVNSGAGVATRLTVRAYCERRGARLREVSDTITLAAESLGTAVARCPGRRVAIAGGFRAGSSNTTIHASRRKGNQRWLTSAANWEFIPVELTVYAYCAKPG